MLKRFKEMEYIYIFHGNMTSICLIQYSLVCVFSRYMEFLNYNLCQNKRKAFSTDMFFFHYCNNDISQFQSFWKNELWSLKNLIT